MEATLRGLLANKEAGLSVPVFVLKAGSWAYGTNVPDSDVDYRGVALPSTSVVFGLTTTREVSSQEPDLKIYEWRRFLNLALCSNPNILEMIWTGPGDAELTSETHARLYQDRSMFLSQVAYKTFAGYAAGQVKRIATGKYNAEGRRRELVEKYGYDTKAAMHAIRLLRMGLEILEEAEVIVRRPDAAELVKIRQGSYSAGEILGEAARLEEKIAQAKETCKLPASPDFAYTEELCIDVMRKHFAA